MPVYQYETEPERTTEPSESEYIAALYADPRAVDPAQDIFNRGPFMTGVESEASRAARNWRIMWNATQAQPKRLSKEEWDARVGPRDMRYAPDADAGQLDSMIAVHDAEKYAQAMMHRTGMRADVAYFAGGIVGSILDPSNVAAELSGMALFKGGAHILGLSNRFASRANALRRATDGRFGGTLNGFLGGAVAIPIDAYMEGRAKQREYTNEDALMSLFGGAAFGAGFDLLRASYRNYVRPTLADDDHIGAAIVEAHRQGVDADADEIAEGIRAIEKMMDDGQLSPEELARLDAIRGGQPQAERHLALLDEFFKDRRESAVVEPADFKFLDGDTKYANRKIKTDTDFEAAAVRISQGDMDAEDALVATLINRRLADGDTPALRRSIRRWANDAADAMGTAADAGIPTLKVDPEYMRRLSQTERDGVRINVGFEDEPSRLVWLWGTIDPDNAPDPAAAIKLRQQAEDVLKLRYGMDTAATDTAYAAMHEKINLFIDKDLPLKRITAEHLLRKVGIESPVLDFGRIMFNESDIAQGRIAQYVSEFGWPFGNRQQRSKFKAIMSKMKGATAEDLWRKGGVPKHQAQPDLDASGFDVVPDLIDSIYRRDPETGQLRAAMQRELDRRYKNPDAPKTPPPLTVKVPSEKNIAAHPSDMSGRKVDVQVAQYMRSIDSLHADQEFKDIAKAMDATMTRNEADFLACVKAFNG